MYLIRGPGVIVVRLEMMFACPVERVEVLLVEENRADR